MDEVIPALLAGGAPYFGQDVTEPKIVETTPRALPAAASPATAATAESLGLDRQFIDALLRHEHVTFSGYTE